MLLFALPPYSAPRHHGIPETRMLAGPQAAVFLHDLQPMPAPRGQRSASEFEASLVLTCRQVHAQFMHKQRITPQDMKCSYTGVFCLGV